MLTSNFFFLRSWNGTTPTAQRHNPTKSLPTNYGRTSTTPSSGPRPYRPTTKPFHPGISLLSCLPSLGLATMMHHHLSRLLPVPRPAASSPYAAALSTPPRRGYARRAKPPPPPMRRRLTRTRSPRGRRRSSRASCRGRRPSRSSRASLTPRTS